MSEKRHLTLDEQRAFTRALRASTKLIHSGKLVEWYCDKCHVMVRQLRCVHCGKSEQEPS